MSEPAAGPTEGQIRLRAYHIWQWLGCPEGYEDEIWAQAERELRTKAAERAALGNAVAAPPQD